MTAIPAPVLAEPPARYLERPALVVDCSAVAGLVFREPWYEAAGSQVDGRSLHAPHLLHNELTSVALKKHRRGEAHALPGLSEAAAMAIELHPIDPLGTLALAQRYTLSAYDAAYLWLASELHCPLLTFDERLGAAARIHLAGLP